MLQLIGCTSEKSLWNEGHKADRGELEIETPGLNTSRGSKHGGSTQKGGSGLDITERELQIIEAIGKRPPSEKRQAAILTLTQQRPWSLGELATAFGLKKVGRLVSKHSTPLVEKGQLQRLYPDNPSHPRQAYYATEEYVGPAIEAADETNDHSTD